MTPAPLRLSAAELGELEQIELSYVEKRSTRSEAMRDLMWLGLTETAADGVLIRLEQMLETIS